MCDRRRQPPVMHWHRSGAWMSQRRGSAGPFPAHHRPSWLAPQVALAHPHEAPHWVSPCWCCVDQRIRHAQCLRAWVCFVAARPPKIAVAIAAALRYARSVPSPPAKTVRRTV
eukprot:scaffold289893_cov32-Tisochrysis_lutea.AAC.3